MTAVKTVADADLIRLARKVLRLDAKKHKRADRWTLRYTYESRGGRTGDISGAAITTAGLRARILNAAKAEADRAALGPTEASERLDAMRARHRREIDEAEAARERAILNDDAGRRLLAEVLAALGDDANAEVANGLRSRTRDLDRPAVGRMLRRHPRRRARVTAR